MIIVQVIEGPRKDEFLSVNVDGKTFPRTTKFVEGREIIIDPILPKNGDIMDLMYEAYQDPNVHVSKCVLRTEAKK
jgi:hypothetical protein